MKRISINKLVSLHPQPTTYVFIDTCAFLDILRLPVKTKGACARLFREYKNLLQKVQNGDVVLVSSYMNYVEQRSNLEAAKTAENNWESNIGNNIMVFEEFAIEVGLITNHIVSTPYQSINFKNHVERLYNTLVGKVFYLPEKLQYDKFALGRVENQIPPAHKKTEYKDCFIWGTCIDLARNVKASDKIAFFSTNTDDFTIDPHHPEALRFQRDASNVQIYTDLSLMMYNI